MKDLKQLLKNPKIYIEQIDRLYFKYKDRNLLFSQSQDDVTFFNFAMDKEKLAKALANDLSKGQYQFSPCIEREIKVGEKMRTIVSANMTDQVVMAVVTDLLFYAFADQHSPNSYAYYRGQHPAKVIRKFSKYLRSQAEDVYLLKSDVSSYTDSIRVDDDAPLWKAFEKMFQKADMVFGEFELNLLKACLCPLIEKQDGSLERNTMGAPTGLIMTTFVANLYLHTLDEAMDKLNGFYARYGDDVVFVHEDPNKIIEAETILTKKLEALGLHRQKKKDIQAYFSNRVHSDPVTWPSVESITFLGFLFKYDGMYGPSVKNKRKMMMLIKDRINASYLLCKDQGFNDKGRAICQAVNQAYCSTDLPEKRVSQMLSNTNDQALLKQLDYFVALHIAKTIARFNSVKAFRQVPYHKMRNDWGLLSLCVLKNKGWRL